MKLEVQRLPEQLGLALQSVDMYEKKTSTSVTAKQDSGSGDSHPDKLKVQRESGEKAGPDNLQDNLQIECAENNDSNNFDDGSSQNKTVTASASNSLGNSHTCGEAEDCVHDKTYVKPTTVFSPTDITFFSNIIDDTVVSPTFNVTENRDEKYGKADDKAVVTGDGCHRNINHGDSDLDPVNGSSICSVLSRQASCGKSFNSHTPDFLRGGMNINIPEDKVFTYDQNKIGNKLTWLGESLKKANFNAYFSSDTVTTDCQKSWKACSDDIQHGRKLSNKIERKTGQVPNKPMNHFKWIVLEDNTIGKT